MKLKSLLTLSLAAGLVMSLASCGKSKTNKPTVAPTSVPTTTVVPTTVTPTTVTPTTVTPTTVKPTVVPTTAPVVHVHDYKAVIDADHISNKVMVGDICVKADYDKICESCGDVAEEKETVSGKWYFEKEPTITEEGSIRIVQADGKEIALKYKDDYSIPVPNLKSEFWTITTDETNCSNVNVTVKGLSSVSPAPPIGPFLGAKGYHIMNFVTLYNAIVKDTLVFETTLDEYHDIDANTGICKNCGEANYLAADLTNNIVDFNTNSCLVKDGETFNVFKVTNATGLVEILYNDKVSKNLILGVQDEEGNAVTFDKEASTFKAEENKEYYVKVYGSIYESKYTVRLGGYRNKWVVGFNMIQAPHGGYNKPVFNGTKIYISTPGRNYEGTMKVLDKEMILPGDFAMVELTLDAKADLTNLGDYFDLYVLADETYKFAGFADVAATVTKIGDATENNRYYVSTIDLYIDPYYTTANGNYYYQVDNSKLAITQDPRDVLGFDVFFDCVDDAGDILAEDVFDIYTSSGMTDEQLEAFFVGKTVKVIEGERTEPTEAVIKSVSLDGTLFLFTIENYTNYDNIIYMYIDR